MTNTEKKIIRKQYSTRWRDKIEFSLVKKSIRETKINCLARTLCKIQRSQHNNYRVRTLYLGVSFYFRQCWLLVSIKQQTSCCIHPEQRLGLPAFISGQLTGFFRNSLARSALHIHKVQPIKMHKHSNWWSWHQRSVNGACCFTGWGGNVRSPRLWLAMWLRQGERVAEVWEKETEGEGMGMGGGLEGAPSSESTAHPGQIEKTEDKSAAMMKSESLQYVRTKRGLI